MMLEAHDEGLYYPLLNQLRCLLAFHYISVPPHQQPLAFTALNVIGADMRAEMGLPGSLVTVRFGELCSLSDSAEPLALRTLRLSHKFPKDIRASRVPECVFVTLFLSFICVDQSDYQPFM